MQEWNDNFSTKRVVGDKIITIGQQDFSSNTVMIKDDNGGIISCPTYIDAEGNVFFPYGLTGVYLSESLGPFPLRDLESGFLPHEDRISAKLRSEIPKQFQHIGNVLYARRKELGLTLYQLRYLTGIHEDILEKYELGWFQSITLTELLVICDILRLKPQQLFSGEDRTDVFTDVFKV